MPQIKHNPSQICQLSCSLRGARLTRSLSRHVSLTSSFCLAAWTELRASLCEGQTYCLCLAKWVVCNLAAGGFIICMCGRVWVQRAGLWPVTSQGFSLYALSLSPNTLHTFPHIQRCVETKPAPPDGLSRPPFQQAVSYIHYSICAGMAIYCLSKDGGVWGFIFPCGIYRGEIVPHRKQAAVICPKHPSLRWSWKSLGAKVVGPCDWPSLFHFCFCHHIKTELRMCPRAVKLWAHTCGLLSLKEHRRAQWQWWSHTSSSPLKS